MSAGGVAAARSENHWTGGGATPTPALQQLVVKPVPILLAKKLRTPVEPVPPDTEHLLAWASEIAQQDLVLPMPVGYLEAPLRTVTTHRVSYYANLYSGKSAMPDSSNALAGGVALPQSGSRSRKEEPSKPWQPYGKQYRLR